MEQLLFFEGWEIEQVKDRKKFLGIRLTHRHKTPITIYAIDYETALDRAVKEI